MNWIWTSGMEGGAQPEDCFPRGEISGISAPTLWRYYRPQESRLTETMHRELNELLEWISKSGCPFIYFTEAVAEDPDDEVVPTHYGVILADYLRSLNLGPIQQFPYRKNGNTDNDVSLFVWTLDYPALETYLSEKEVR